MKVCFTSDLHGSASLYDQLEALLATERPDLLILGGDLLPDSEPIDEPDGQLAYVGSTFLPRLDAWRRQFPALRRLILPGNHDWRPTLTLLRESMARHHFTVLSLDRPHAINGTAFVGFHHTPWTPHGLKDFERLDHADDAPPAEGGYSYSEESGAVLRVDAPQYYRAYPSIADMLSAAPSYPAPWVFVCHAPPNATGLDELPELDQPIGSRAIRDFIEARQPRLALHGHVHEAYEKTATWRTTLGSTICVNAGQAERLHAVLFDLADPGGTLRHTVHP